MMMILLNTALRNADCKGNERIKLNFRKKAQQTRTEKEERSMLSVLGWDAPTTLLPSIPFELNCHYVHYVSKKEILSMKSFEIFCLELPILLWKVFLNDK